MVNTMDERSLCKGLVSLKGHKLRLVYALLQRTNTIDLLISRGREALSAESEDAFGSHLEREISQLEGEEDAMLQLDIFSELGRLMNVIQPPLTNEAAIRSQADSILEHAYSYLEKQNKVFKQFADVQTGGTKLDHMIHFIMLSLLDIIDTETKEYSEEELEATASALHGGYLDTLSDESKQELAYQIGKPVTTMGEVKRIIRRSELSTLFSAAAEIEGVSSYLGVKTMLPVLLKRKGVKVPFAEQTDTSYLTAAFASPFFFLPVILGNSFFSQGAQHFYFKKLLVPSTIVYISLLSSTVEEETCEPLLKAWEKRTAFYKDELERAEQLKNKISAQESVIRSQEQKIQSLKQELDKSMSALDEAKNDIWLSLYTSGLKEWDINDTFSSHRSEYREAMNRLNEIERQRRKHNPRAGFRSMMNRTAAHVTTYMDEKKEKREANEAMRKMVDEFIDAEHAYEPHKKAAALERKKMVDDLQNDKQEAEYQKEQERRRWKEYKEQYKENLASIRALERDNGSITK
ncbi:hypothetical protein ATL39_0641 [Sinobaca qinghaiensis]|uniref:Uncharacterized protein n=2 Tax=Sinobaca qinghaiensis TaxID=342944 RepID=A0A419V8I7_9BACL|nr:hypothetical protein ATL39_0641 [Sinobaca qinghaiensis]